MTLNPNQHAPSGEPPAGVGWGGMAAFDKSALLRTYAHAWRVTSLIETGLFNGAGSGMGLKSTEAVKRYIALDYQLENIQAAMSKGFEAVHGDSSVTLDYILNSNVYATVEPPCLFWLDAHAVYDDEDSPTACPVLSELDAIIRWEHQKTSVVLIDDLWGFGTVRGWPSVDELREKVDGYWNRDEIEGVMVLTPCG